jgi:hypothetical protein
VISKSRVHKYLEIKPLQNALYGRLSHRLEGSKFPRCVFGLEVVVAPGRVTIKARRSSYASITIVHGSSASIASYPAKIPHFFESLQIIAFYAILLRTPLIAYKSFMEGHISGFQRVVCRLAGWRVQAKRD